MQKQFFLTVLFTSVILSVQAQDAEEFRNLQKKYKDDPACYYSVKKNVEITIKKDVLSITSHNERKTFLLSDNAAAFAPDRIAYSNNLEEITGISAATYVPSNNKYKRLEVEKIEDRKPRTEVFYDDLREKHFNFPGLQQGALATLEYDVTLNDPHFLGSFVFQGYIPVKEAEYSITFPKEVSIKYFFQDANKLVDFTETVHKNKTTYTWKAKDVEALKYFGDAPDLDYYAPLVCPYVDYYEINGKRIKVFSDVDQYYNWVYNNVKDVNRIPCQNLKVTTDSLIKGITDRTEKIKKIYYWVQENIKYIAFEEGMGGFIPREASLVYERKFGDCKDKSSILQEMYRYAGIESYLTLIGTREIPFTNKQLPTNNANNHMIIALKDENDKWIFLDGTNRAMQYSYPSYAIQGKDALIVIDSTHYEIVPVPVVDVQHNQRIDSLKITCDGKNLKGSSHTYITGLIRESYATDIGFVSDKEKEKNIHDLVRFGNNKCTIDSLTYTGLTDFSDTLAVHASFNIPDYLQTIDNRIFVNMNLHKPMQGSTIDTTKRTVDREFNFLAGGKEVIELVIPPGFIVKKIPQGGSFKNEWFGYNISYTQKGNSIFLEKKLFVKTLLVKKEMFNEWNDFIKSLSDTYGQVVAIEKK